MQVFRNITYIILLAVLLSSCAGTNSIQPSNNMHSSVPEYSDLYYWAAHPGKQDNSDSTPRPYRNFVRDTSVDVFFIYPTSYTADTMVNDANEKLKWNAAINNDALNSLTDATSILYQASAFNKYRVFAPRYRQAHIKAFFISDSLSKPFFDTAYEDVENAFNYYLQHYNNGRPFIIASHSQGTLHAARLIKEHIDNTPLMKQMVAAYIIGLPVAENYFTTCVPCRTATQTNCFVSWRTFRKNYTAPYVFKENYKAVVVNPLTWTMDTTIASKKLNDGAVFYKFNHPKKHAVSAQVHGNILWSSKPHFMGSIVFTRKNYHIGDINFFWKNIRENVDARVHSFKNINTAVNP